MAEIQQSTNSADLTRRFIELVMMNAQQAALCLGQIPHPSTGKAEINLDAAKMFIDHLEIIREKTRGNLNKDEEKILTSVLSELQLSFVQATSNAGTVPDEQKGTPDQQQNDEATDMPQSSSQSIHPGAEPSSHAAAEEGKKKFTKSYGS